MIDYLRELELIFNSVEPDDNEISNAIDEMPEYFQWACGETRYAIWHSSWDFVIKIPRYGYASEDYCQIEVDNYECAKKWRVEKICLPIEVYKSNIFGLTLYKQARYTNSTGESYQRRIGYKKYLEKRNINKIVDTGLPSRISDCCYGHRGIDSYWTARVLQLYGKKFCRSFEAWTMECRINDLHNQNTGWLNNKPILLDYAGYHE